MENREFLLPCAGGEPQEPTQVIQVLQPLVHFGIHLSQPAQHVEKAPGAHPGFLLDQGADELLQHLLGSAVTRGVGGEILLAHHTPQQQLLQQPGSVGDGSSDLLGIAADVLQHLVPSTQILAITWEIKNMGLKKKKHKTRIQIPTTMRTNFKVQVIWIKRCFELFALSRGWKLRDLNN